MRSLKDFTSLSKKIFPSVCQIRAMFSYIKVVDFYSSANTLLKLVFPSDRYHFPN
jgi:hypothetical protein